MLQHVRARISPAALVPTTLVLSTALAFGMIATAPAQAAQTTSSSRAVATKAAATPATVVPTAAQKAATAKALAKARAARAAAAKAAKITRIRYKIVALAKSRVGHARYVAGAAGPNRFDCSGLALWVYKKAAGISLPHYSKAQFNRVHKISKSQLRPGDLVFFFRNGAHHVAIYIGGGKMVGAANPRSGIKIDKVFGSWYGSHYSGAGRLL